MQGGLVRAHLVCALALAASQALASPNEFFWNNPSGGDYATPGDWTPAGPPTGADDANFNLGSAGYTVGFSAANSARRLVVQNDNVNFDLGGNQYSLSDTAANIQVAPTAGQVGNLTVQNGTVSGFSALVGGDAGSQGTLTVDGSAGAASVQTTNGAVIGSSGSGSVVVQNGGNVTAIGDTNVAQNAGSSGSISVDGAGSTFTVSGTAAAYIGGSSSGTGGTASLSVTNGGAFTAPSTTIQGPTAGSAQATASGSGSSINTGALTVGLGHAGFGTLSASSGAIVNASSVEIGNAGNGQATFDGSGTTLAVSTGTTTVGDEDGSGALTFQNGATFGSAGGTARRIEIAATPASTGTATVTGSNTAITTDTLDVGHAGTGIVNVQNGGQLTVTSDINVASSSGSHGQINVDGAGSTLTGQGALYVGGTASGAGGTGHLSVTNGGAVAVSGGITNWSTGTIDLQSGSITANVANAGVFHNNATLTGNLVNNAGGVFSGTGTTTGTVTLNSGSTIAPGNAIGTMNVGATTWNPGAHFTFNINSALGSSGSDPGWNLLNINGALNLTGTSATPLNLDVVSLLANGSPGALTDFDPSQPNAWIFATASGGITGFAPSEFSIDASQFANSLGGYTFQVAEVGNSLELITVLAPKEFFWNAPASGAYADSSQWTPSGGPPGSNDGANFNTGSAGLSVSFAADATARHLTVDNDNVTLGLAGHQYQLADVNDSTTRTVVVGQSSGSVGNLTVQNGTLVGNNTTIGYHAGSQGTLTVDGSQGAASLQNGSSLNVGQTGNGSLVVTAGGQATSSGLVSIGNDSGSAGSISVTGAGSSFLISAGDVYVGNMGAGSISITNGGSLNAPSSPNAFYVALLNGSSGQISVDGAGSTFTAAGSVGVGGQLTGFGGSGSVSVTNGGSFTANNLSITGGPTSAGQVTVDAATLNAGNLSIGVNGSATTSSNQIGTLTAQNAAQVTSGVLSMGTGGSGQATFDGAGTSFTLTGTGDSIVGDSSGAATLTFQNSASFGDSAGGTARRLIVGNQSTATGTITATGSGTTATTTATLDIGHSGTGNLNVLAGAQWNHTGDLTTGSASGSHGNVLVDGAGSLLAISGNAYIGGTASGAGGSALLTLSNGGSLTANTLTTYGTGSVHIDQTSTLTANVVNNGGVRDDGLLIGNVVNNGALGGVGTITGTLTLNGGSFTSTGAGPIGTLTAGATNWFGNAHFLLNIDSALGTAGQSNGWDLLNITGGLALHTSPSSIPISLISVLSNGTQGNLSDFDPMQNYAWTFATALGGITGFSANGFQVISSGFQGGTLPGSRFHVIEVGNSLELTYTAPVPEPGTLVLAAAGAITLLFFGWRKRRPPR